MAEEKEVDFGATDITIKGDKSFWRLVQESGGGLTLIKIGYVRDEKGEYPSLIPILEEYRGDKVEITKRGIILYLGDRLLINTEKEDTALSV